MPIEALLVPWLTSTLGVRAVTELPGDLQDVLPLIRLTTAGGSSDVEDYRLSRPRVSIASFAAGYLPAAELAEQVEAAMRRQLRGSVLGTSTVTFVNSVQLPTWVPYADTTLRQFTATYEVVIKSHS